MAEHSNAPGTVRENIRRILEIERSAVHGRGRAERWAEAIGGFIGTGPFVAAHAVVVGVWAAINERAFGLPVFDPYPFNLLSTVASLEAVVLTAFVLMKQRRMSRLSDRRDHLDLQVNLLTEREVSLLIEMVDRIGRRLGMEDGTPPEAMDLSRATTTGDLVEELHRALPDADLGALRGKV